MENKFIYNLGTFFMDMQIESLMNYSEENFEYDSLRKAQVDDSGKCMQIVNTLPQADKEFLKNYDDKENEITGMEFDRLYLQGYKDCVKLLKHIGVLA